MLVNLAAELIVHKVDSLDGLFSYLFSVINYIAIFGALILATNLGATSLDYFFPYTPDKVQFEARSRLVTADDIAKCDQCSICLVEYKAGVDRICQLDCHKAHIYHTECLVSAVHYTGPQCPLCK